MSRLHEVVVLSHRLVEAVIIVMSVLIGVVVRHVSTVIGNRALLVVTVQVLDVKGASSLVVAQVGSGSGLQSHVVGTGPALRMQVLT